MICTPKIIREIKSSKGEIWRPCETGEVQTLFRRGYLRERVHLEDLDVVEKLILKWIFKTLGE